MSRILTIVLVLSTNSTPVLSNRNSVGSTGTELSEIGKQCTMDVECGVMEKCYKSNPYALYGTCVSKY